MKHAHRTLEHTQRILAYNKINHCIKPFSFNCFSPKGSVWVGEGSESGGGGVSLLSENVVYATMIVMCFIFPSTAQQRALRLLHTIVLRSS